MIEIVHGSVVDQRVDAIVNAANRRLSGGGGVDGAIHVAAGPQLDEACRALGGCETGDAKLTPSFGITTCHHIVHTVGPVWRLRGAEQSARLLASCYRRSCEVALEAGDRSIAFCSISTGVYRYPFDDATRVALATLLPQSQRFERTVFALWLDSEFEEGARIAQEAYRCRWDGPTLLVEGPAEG